MTVVIRNWRDETPYVGHESAIIWPIFRARGTAGRSPEQAPLRGLRGFTLHMLQGGKAGDYHVHEDAEQIYYFVRGEGKMGPMGFHGTHRKKGHRTGAVQVADLLPRHVGDVECGHRLPG